MAVIQVLELIGLLGLLDLVRQLVPVVNNSVGEKVPPQFPCLRRRDKVQMACHCPALCGIGAH